MYSFLGLHFSKWLLFLWPLRFIMRINVKPEGFSREKLFEATGGRDVVFVFPRMYVLDAFVLNIALRRMQIPRVRLEARPNRFRTVGLLGIRSRPAVLNPIDRRDRFSDDLATLMREDARMQSGQLVLIPVSVFYSRGAERNDRNFILKSLLPDDGNANAFQKLLLLLLHSGNLHLHFGKPLDLAAELALDKAAIAESDTKTESKAESLKSDSLKLQGTIKAVVPGNRGPSKGTHSGPEWAFARKIRRALLIDFNRERTAVLGPELYELQTIANWILRNDEFQKLLTATENPTKSGRKAVRYLAEIAANYNYTTIRALETLLDFVWTRIFKGVRVRNFDAVSQVAKTGQIVWMPCHRSHLDYMLLSYVLFKKGLVTPHVAAGVNLSFWPAGPILRRGGAFFLRRSFQGNKIYAAVFAQYMNFLMHNSFPVEFFHEGGRSRIGKLLSPKFGLTTFCVASILRRKAKNTYIIPVYFGYDKVMEDDSYAAELSGAKKQKESVWQLLKSVRYFFSNYGTADVSFGAPIHFGDTWQAYFGQAAAVSQLSNGPGQAVSGPAGSGQANTGQAAGLSSATGAGVGTGGSGSALGLLPADLADLSEDIESRDPRVQMFVRSLARRVNQGINSTATASGSALLTASLLAMAEPSISRSGLLERICTLHWLVNRLGVSLGWTIATSAAADADAFLLSSTAAQQGTEPSVVTLPLPTSASLEKVAEDILETGLQWAFALEKRDGQLRTISRNPQKEMNLWWYRGTMFHILAIPGLVVALLESMSADDRTMARLESCLQAIRNVWDEELFWPDTTSTGTMGQAALGLLQELGTLNVSSDGSFIVLSGNPAHVELRAFLSELVRPERELYSLQLAAALALIETRGKFARDELIRKATAAHRSAFLRGVAGHPATLSVVFGSRTFDALYKAGIFVPHDKQMLSVAFTELVSVSGFFDVDVWKEFMA